MKSILYANSRMVAIVLFALFSLFFVSQNARANDYLEVEKHYNAYAGGAEKIHFVIPVWAYGKGYDYYAYSDSYISYTPTGGSETRIAWYKTDAYDENENKKSAKGTAFIKLLSDQGAIVVTSMASGVNYHVAVRDNWTERLYVNQIEDDGCPQVTRLEFDWYPPESLDDKTFQVNIVSKFRRSLTDGNAMTCRTTYPTQSTFTNKTNVMTPQLYTPYIYQVNENGPTGYGYAAVPYMLFNDPISYHTSLDTATVKITDRAGSLYVMTTDTVQEQFKATFKMWRGADEGARTETERTSVGVDIPPYHRIYGFSATEERDSSDTFTGNNIIRWMVKNPALKDLVDGDYFEIQRALNKDFSDAERLEVVQMTRGENKGFYIYVDKSRDTWNGNAQTEDVVSNLKISVSDPHYILNDQNGNPLAELDVRLESDKLNIPAVPVYYRIRRASSSVWGWDNEFVSTASLYKYNFLAPLAEAQEPYELDTDYADNHKVHFRFKIENVEPKALPPTKNNCTLSCNLNKVLKEDEEINLSFHFVQYENARVNLDGTTAVRILDADSKIVMDWTYIHAGSYTAPVNCSVQVKNTSGMTYNIDEVFTFSNILKSSLITCYSEPYIHGSQEFSARLTTEDITPLTPDKDKNDMDVAIQFSHDPSVNDPEGITAFRVVGVNDSLVMDWTYLRAGLYQFPENCTVYVKNHDSKNYNGEVNYSFQITEPSIITCRSYYFLHGAQQFIADRSFNDQIVDGIVKQINERLYTVKDSLYTLLLQQQMATDYGRAMWDRSASLVLTRTQVETGQTQEVIIPQDSIVRQADGNWIATYTDVADKACTHYIYSVRINQSRADLHVQDSASLQPIVLTGPELYYDDGAYIRNFTATQGDATTQMKNGVLLRWETNSNNFDEFLILRKEVNSTASADTLIATTQNSYFDRSATPLTHYEYTVEAVYTCNGRRIVNAATAEGWRTPYGEISGTVSMSDNTGMAGVTVALQDSAGKIVRSMLTDATGAYKFDSLEYNVVICDQPTLNLEYTSNYSIWQPEKYTQIRVSEPNGEVLKDWATAQDLTYQYPIGTIIEIRTSLEDCTTAGKIYSFQINKHGTLEIDYSRTKKSSTSYTYSFTPTLTELADVDCRNSSNSNYIVVPTSQYGTFSFNNTSAGTAAINLSQYEAVAQGIDFVNTSSTRLTGRVLYKMSTIPVAGAMFLLNGDTVRRGNIPVKTGVDGNFELVLPLHQPCRLQVFKPGHTFEGDGILRVEGESEDFALTKPLDGVRFYDETKVRLVGRVAGGNDQRDLPHGFGLGQNNLGDNLQLVLQLEGDNTAHIVHDPDDLTLDTIRQTTPHVVNQPYMADTTIVGTTHSLFEKKRITIQPDPETGEFQIDLFPVRYKVIQATATGYATLFASGQGNETFDLTNAPTVIIADTLEGKTVQYNAIYDRIYHTPMQVSLTQMIYGLERDGLGEPNIEVSNIDPSLIGSVNLYDKQQDGSIDYLLGYPVFIGGRKYQFTASAYEDYYYNNDRQAGTLDRVPLRGGSITIRNGLSNAKASNTYALNQLGRNTSIWLSVDNIDVNNVAENAIRPVSVALEQEGNTVETEVFRGYVTGTAIQEKDLRMTDSKIVLLDIVRDPGGAGSSAWVESGSVYNYSYKENYKWNVGLTINIKYGLNVSMDVGVVTAPPVGVGSYSGSTFTTSKQISVPIPISHKWDWGYQHDYTITTTERISTSTSSTPKGVGAMADVFFGTTLAQLAGKAKTISVIGDSLYRMRKPAIDAGAMRVIASGTANGENYYLVTGQKIVLGSTLHNTFAYTQHYILNTVIPEIGMERQNLLMNFSSREEAKAAANARGEEVYWYHPTESITIRDTLPRSYYEMVTPDNDEQYTDRVAALDHILLDWMTIIYQNEKEKVGAMGSSSRRNVGTYSVSYGATFNHTDAYSAASNYNEMPQGWGLIGSDASTFSTGAGRTVLNNLFNNLSSFWKSRNGSTFGKSALDALQEYQTTQDGEGNEQLKNANELGTVTNTSKFSFSFEPVFNFQSDVRQSDTKTIKKSAGFNIVSDPDGDITVSCYCVPYQVWADTTKFIRDQIATLTQDDDNLYGSYVFITQAGATFCPHEAEERTLFYNKGTLMSNGTQWIVKPEMTANTYEITNVQPQNKATFTIQLMNNSEVDAGVANDGHSLTLMLNGETNPYGAKLTVDGMPLTQGISYWVVPGRPIIKTLEVERGTVDDYENLQLMLFPSDCMKTLSTMNLSVHFLPVSSDVSIASPRQNWIMNTLSAQDSVGYYIPIDINGFDVNHKNFDHIEFQYKLSTQSEDDWVNQCSFYASDSLYRLATGNKAMIENGRIVPFRFYGERDPMEQRYDLRAVSYCRYGSGFVTKASPVISGTKDTRPPRVFGDPEPVNAILGVGDNLKLRFNEPIAGNYLDEDNNFQLVGYTNETGITTNASVHFDGTMDSYASTQVSRSLEARSYSIDMVVKPTSPDAEAVFFEHGFDRTGVVFGKTADNRLYLQFGTYMIFSKPLPERMLDFTRVVMSYNYANNTLRFYVGTEDVSDPEANPVPDIPYSLNAPLVFGRGMDGNMLEVRLWTKPLTQEEVAATNMRYLTGFEQELVAYYQMNEAAGNTISDKAAGATLTLHGASWNLPKGISLALKNGERVTLAKNLLSHSAVYDATYMLWFRNTSTTGTIFSAGDKRFTLADSQLQWQLNDSTLYPLGTIGTNEWHHLVLAINHTYNNVALYVDGKMMASYPATRMTGMTGDMFFGGDGFEGNIDEFVVFEQALPKTLIQEYGNRTPAGDEMGLMAYLPFEQQKQNANGVLELVFSPNDQRQFRDANGNVVDKAVPLLLESNQPILADHADKATYAPVTGFGLLSKLNFDWAFNQDELLINLKMADREINKQTLYITVRDVEDLNGNPMSSPVTWTAFVDRNALKWDYRQVEFSHEYNSTYDDMNYMDISFTNHSGRRHQYTIESLPAWLTIDETYGSVDPTEYKQVRFFFDLSMPVGTYTDLIYLTDENGLSEPLRVNYEVKAEFPWNEPSASDYPFNMSVCGQIQLEGEILTNTNDKVIALCRNECVGMANIDFDNLTNRSRVFLTIYGNEQMSKKTIRFMLWQSSTGKVLTLTPSVDITFAHGAVYGCGYERQVIFTAGGSEVQNITLQPGWNWTSFNIGVYANQTGVINNVMTTSKPWTEGDLIKNPSTRNFCIYSDSLGQFVGSLYHFRYVYSHMFYSMEGNTIRVSGSALPQDSMHVTLRGNGQWSPLPCLFSQPTPVAEALADYFDNASEGDMVKAHNRFAYFSENKRWEGNLTALQPGEGYFFRRLGQGDVEVHFYDNNLKSAALVQRTAARSAAPTQGVAAVAGQPYMADNGSHFRNPHAATNMTMIATVEQPSALAERNQPILADLAASPTSVASSVEGQPYMTDNAPVLRVYAGTELAAIAHPQQIDGKTYYFLTIQSDNTDANLRFLTDDGTELRLINESTLQIINLANQPDAHYGSLRAPMQLVVTKDTDRVYKIFENGHVIIIRNNERYDITGRRLNK